MPYYYMYSVIFHDLWVFHNKKLVTSWVIFLIKLPERKHSFVLWNCLALLFKGGATLQLSWTSKTSPWALTLFFKLNAPYFGSIKVWGYIWICMRLISPKVPLSNFFLPKWLESKDLGATQQCVIFWLKVFKNNNF